MNTAPKSGEFPVDEEHQQAAGATLISLESAKRPEVKRITSVTIAVAMPRIGYTRNDVASGVRLYVEKTKSGYRVAKHKGKDGHYDRRTISVADPAYNELNSVFENAVQSLRKTPISVSDVQGETKQRIEAAAAQAETGDEAEKDMAA